MTDYDSIASRFDNALAGPMRAAVSALLTGRADERRAW